ncbi:hypothetical protein [Anaerobaca lacustris]|uniref:Uncharacterized protein n=1 Tax=Anaerobaca lacustris TaxID=3044600 RepID=A0AAW6TXV7_9BACT|nr:hypothetical protein [Sedimentisphaerales bacterium M17dextr]
MAKPTLERSQPCEVLDINPCHCLTELNQHANELAASPADWMPWTCRDTLTKHATPESI